MHSLNTSQEAIQPLELLDLSEIPSRLLDSILVRGELDSVDVPEPDDAGILTVGS